MNEKYEMPNAEMQQYFDTLPAFVQENMKQTGVCIRSMEALKACAEHILQKQQAQ